MLKLLIIDIAIYAASIIMFILAIFGVLPVLYPAIVFGSGFVFEMILIGYEIKHAHVYHPPTDFTPPKKDA